MRRVVPALVIAVGVLLGTAAPASAAPRLFPDPVGDSDRGGTDVVAVGADLSPETTQVIWDTAVANADQISYLVDLDVNGDGDVDFQVFDSGDVYDAGFNALCEATRVRSGRRVIVSVPSACLGQPGQVRVNLFLYSGSGFDWAPGIDSYTPAVGVGPSAASSTGRLYDAYFLRQPDTGGWCYWIDQNRGGLPLGAISDYFAGSPEFQARYGQLDLPRFVRQVYLNVFSREPDPGGYTYWAGRLSTGGVTRGGMMLFFSESPEFVATRPVPPAPAC